MVISNSLYSALHEQKFYPDYGKRRHVMKVCKMLVYLVAIRVMSYDFAYA